MFFHINNVNKPIVKAEKEAIKEGVEQLIKTEGKEAAKEVGNEAAEKLAKEEAEKLAKAEAERIAKEEAAKISKRYGEIAQEGHATTRHGAQVTERQLDDRAMHGIDPASGTTNDAYNKFPDGTPRPHKSGKDATKFVSQEALVKAEDYIKNSVQGKKAFEEALRDGANTIVFEKTIKLEDIYGANYKNQVFGKTRLGSKAHPTGSVETDFTDGTIKAIFKKDSTGKWNLETMYPEPK